MPGKEYSMTFKIDGKTTGAYSGAFKAATQQLAAMQSQIQLLNKAQSDISSYQKQQGAVEQTRARLQNLMQQHDLLQKEIDETSGSTAALEREKLKLEQRITDTSEKLSSQEQRLAETDGRLKDAGVDTANLTSESHRLANQLDELQKEQAETADGFQKGGEAAQDFKQETVDAVDAAQQVLAAAGIAKMLQAISEEFMSCVNAAAEFEAGMSNVEALSGATGEQMAQLTALAKELGATTKFTALEASDAMGYMAMAGWDANDMLSGMDGVLQLAAASGEDLATVSDIVTDSLTAFGLTAKDTARFSDILAATATSANTNVSMMGDTFKYAAPLAGALGYSVEDVATMIGLMANAGIKGSQSGTALRNMFSKLTDGAELSAAAFGDITVETQNADGTMKGLSEVISELRERFGEMTKAEKIANATALVGERSMSGFITLMNAADGDFESLTKKITNCDGAAQKMAQIKLDNVNGQLTLMQSAWDAVSVSVGETFAPMMKDTYKTLTELGNQINQFVKAHPGVVKGIAAIAAGVAVFTGALAAYKAVTLLANAAQALLNFTMMANPFGLVAAGIAAVVGGLAFFIGSMHESNEEVLAMTEASRALNDTLASTKKAYEDTVTTTVATADVADRYISRLEELEDTYGDAASEQEEYRTVLSLLCQTVPELSEHINTETGEIQGGTEALRENTEEWKRNAVEQAKQKRRAEVLEAYTKAQVEQQEAEIRLRLATEALTLAWKDHAEAAQRSEEILEEISVINNDETMAYDEKMAKLEELNEEYQTLQNTMMEFMKDSSKQEELADLTQAQSDALEALNISNDALAEAETQLDLTNKAVDELAESETDAAEVTRDLGTSAEELTAALQGPIEKAQELGEAYQKAYDDAYSGISGSFGLFDKVATEVETSVADMIAALDSQAEYMANYTANLQKAAEMGISDGLLAELSDGSAQSAAYLQEIVTNGGDKVQELNKKFAEVQKGKDDFAKTVAEMQTDFGNEMHKLVAELEQTVADMDLRESAAAAGYNTIQGFIDAANDPNTSARVYSAYSWMAKQAAKAISDNSGSVSTVTVGEKKYAAGTDYAAPGLSLVGEEGPELIMMRGGEKVLTASETAALMDGRQASNIIPFPTSMTGVDPVNADAIDVAPSPGNKSFQITLQPVYNITSSGDPADLEEQLRTHGEWLVEKVREIIEDMDDDEKRREYA